MTPPVKRRAYHSDKRPVRDESGQRVPLVLLQRDDALEATWKARWAEFEPSYRHWTATFNPEVKR